MKALPTLLRIAKRDLEMLRRALADQLAKAAAVEERIRTHAQTIRDEQQAALKDYESARAYGGFAGLAVAGRRALEAEGAAIQVEIQRIRDLMTEAHVEMRKFERLLELQAERARAAAAKRDDAELDEISTLTYGVRQRALRYGD